MSRLQERLRAILTNAPPEPYTRKGEEMYHTLTKAADALDAMERALSTTVTAWEAIGGNQRHSAATIERWLQESMKPAIDGIRATLAKLEADNG